MQLYQVFDHFLDPTNDREWWPMEPGDGDRLHDTIPLMAGLVRLSGMMDGCETGEDLREAVEHTMSLVNSGEIATWSCSQEAAAVNREVREFHAAAERLFAAPPD